MFMGVVHTLLRSNTAASGMLSKNIVQELNRELFQKNQNQYFLTLFVGVLDLNNGLLNYCNAAHTTSFVLSREGEIIELTGTHGLPVGLYANKYYEGSVYKLIENDVLFMYTDGVTETIDADMDRFGEKRLKNILAGLKGKSPKEIVFSVENKLRVFKGVGGQVDDYSIVALKFRIK